MTRAFFSATLVAIAAQSAFAADRALPPPRAQAPLYAPARAHDWTGFYIGINGGGAWGESTYDFAGAGAGSTDVGTSGVLLGGTVGAQLPDGLHRARHRGRPRLVERPRQRRLPARLLRDAQPVALHRARAARLRLRPLPAVCDWWCRHRRGGGESPGRRQRQRHPRRLDRRAAASSTRSPTTGAPSSSTSTSTSASSIAAAPAARHPPRPWTTAHTSRASA